MRGMGRSGVRSRGRGPYRPGEVRLGRPDWPQGWAVAQRGGVVLFSLYFVFLNFSFTVLLLVSLYFSFFIIMILFPKIVLLLILMPLYLGHQT